MGPLNGPGCVVFEGSHIVESKLNIQRRGWGALNGIVGKIYITQEERRQRKGGDERSAVGKRKVLTSGSYYQTIICSMFNANTV